MANTKFVENERDEVVLNFIGSDRKHGQLLGVKGWLAAIDHWGGFLRFHQDADWLDHGSHCR
jgi:hypothetical protein